MHQADWRQAGRRHVQLDPGDPARSDRHDDAYDWVKNRVFEVNPTSGALQLYEVTESAPALEAFAGRIQMHGSVSEDVRVLSNGYRVRHSNWFMSKLATRLSIEIEAEIFPDGIGPFDIVEFFARVDVQYDCIFEHACHMAPQWNYFGDDARRAPEHLANGRSTGLTGSGTCAWKRL